MKFLCLLFAVCGLVFPAAALDREAFTFTNYDLSVRVEPEQHRLGVRGKVSLRNDSATPQKMLALQISSSLDWRSIQLGGKALDFTTRAYTSDIDHTGSLSEAIVTLPQEIPPKGALEVEVGYEGVILLDAMRLTRIGVPEDKAKHVDWDQISHSFTAVRGVGYVAWYPIATEAANLSDSDSLSTVLGRWKARQAETRLKVLLESTKATPIFFSGAAESSTVGVESGVATVATYRMGELSVNVPTFVIADYEKLRDNAANIEYLEGQQDAADDYADIASQIEPLVPGVAGSRGLQILALPDADASPFVTEGLFLTPLKSPVTNEAELDLVYALARQSARSPRMWIEEGLAHYAQAQFVESHKGLQAALDYLEVHRAVLVGAEKNALDSRALIDPPDDLAAQTKAMYVWWMLKDMLEKLPTEALANYNPADDKDASYMQKLIEKQTHRDLQWFFDDWVYHDRGLPDFHVASVFSTPIETGGFLVTITVENLGTAGAEVPVTLEFQGGVVRRRLEVRAKAKATVRVEVASAPQEVVVNDESVPESDMSNNTYKVESLNH